MRLTVLPRAGAKRLCFLLSLVSIAICSTVSIANAAYTELISYDYQADGIDGLSANEDSADSVISSDGRYVAFSSGADDLIENDTNHADDIFVYDRLLKTTERVSVDIGGGNPNSGSLYPSISGDGRYVTFSSWATDLVSVSTGGIENIFVYDRQEDETKLVSVDSSGRAASRSTIPVISADGTYIAFTTQDDLDPEDDNGKYDAYVCQSSGGECEVVSVDSDPTSSDGGDANGASQPNDISSDGRYVTFDSDATDLVINDTNAKRDIFLRDREADNTIRVSVDHDPTDSDGGNTDGSSFSSSISDDGNYIVYSSYAGDVVAGDGNAFSDVFLYDRLSSSTKRVSLTTDGGSASKSAFDEAISPDGRYIGFSSTSPDFVANDFEDTEDAFLYDQELGRVVERISVDADPNDSDLDSADGDSYRPSISTDGAYVSFVSRADDLLLEKDHLDFRDIFVRARYEDLPVVDEEESEQVDTLPSTESTAPTTPTTTSELGPPVTTTTSVSETICSGLGFTHFRSRYRYFWPTTSEAVSGIGKRRRGTVLKVGLSGCDADLTVRLYRKGARGQVSKFLGTVFSSQLAEENTEIPVSGWLNGRRLRPGTYRLVATAKGGGATAKDTLTIRIAKRKR